MSRDAIIEELLETWTEQEATKLVTAVREHLKHQAAPSSRSVLDRLVNTAGERRRLELMAQANDEEHPGPELTRLFANECLPDAIRRAKARCRPWQDSEIKGDLDELRLTSWRFLFRVKHGFTGQEGQRVELHRNLLAWGLLL